MSFHEQEAARYKEIEDNLTEESKAAKKRVIRAVLEDSPMELPDIDGWYYATGPLLTARHGDRLYCLLPGDEGTYPGGAENIADHVNLTVIDL